MRATRRDVLKGAAVTAGAAALPVVFRGGRAFADVDPESADRRRLVVIFLAGGNDGLNTVVPVGNVAGGARRDVYEAVRPVVKVPVANVNVLDRTAADAGHQVGLNKAMPALYSLYQQDRLAVVQGVDYPGHSYSHFSSTDFWQSGQPQDTVTSGWVGRHLDRAGIADGELRAVAVGRDLPLLFEGEASVGRINSAVAFESVGSVRFYDGVDGNPEFASRHNKYAGYAGYPAADEMRAFYGDKCLQARQLVSHMSTVPPPPGTATYLANAMLTARTMLSTNLGVEIVYVVHYGGYDTHSAQVPHHENLLREVDQAIEVFLHGTMGGVTVPGAGPIDPALGAKTLVLAFSEFGRTIGDNGSGTDHGSAAPVFVVGPPPGPGTLGLVSGLHGEHPDMGTQTLPSDDIDMTTDVRRVYRAILNDWLEDDDPYYTGVTPLPLFASL